MPNAQARASFTLSSLSATRAEGKRKFNARSISFGAASIPWQKAIAEHMFGLFGARPAAGEDEAAAEAEPLGSGAERSPGRPPEAEPGGEQLAAQRLPLT